jgi:hypothetical protein
MQPASDKPSATANAPDFKKLFVISAPKVAAACYTPCREEWFHRSPRFPGLRASPRRTERGSQARLRRRIARSRAARHRGDSIPFAVEYRRRECILRQLDAEPRHVQPLLRKAGRAARRQRPEAVKGAGRRRAAFARLEFSLSQEAARLGRSWSFPGVRFAARSMPLQAFSIPVASSPPQNFALVCLPRAQGLHLKRRSLTFDFNQEEGLCLSEQSLLEPHWLSASPISRAPQFRSPRSKGLAPQSSKSRKAAGRDFGAARTEFATRWLRDVFARRDIISARRAISAGLTETSRNESAAGARG